MTQYKTILNKKINVANIMSNLKPIELMAELLKMIIVQRTT